MEIPFLDLIVPHIIENAYIDGNASFSLKEEFASYKTHLIRAYECLHISIKELTEVGPIIVETKADIFNGDIISVSGGTCTADQARVIVRGLTRMRTCFRNSKLHYSHAQEKEAILINNNVSFVRESDMFNFSFEDKANLAQDILSITGVV